MKAKRNLKGMISLIMAVCMFSSISITSNAVDGNGKRDCGHDLTFQIVSQTASETQDGIINTYCSKCGNIVEEKTIHAYKTYTIELGNNKFATIKGWLESDYDDTSCDFEKEYLDTKSMSYEVINRLNSYRSENGKKSLEWNSSLQDTANLRALEAAYSFAHTRPNGEEWYMANESMLGGENLARGYKSAARVMEGWKKSQTHNENLLMESFKSVAVGVFHLYQFSEDEKIPKEKIVWAQSFSYMPSP